MSRHRRNVMWLLVLVWFVGLFNGMVQAAAPSTWSQSNITTQPYVMGIMARVHQNGSALKVPGSKVAVFYGNDLRAVADYDNDDDLYFYNLTVAVAATTESGYVFKYYNPTDDTVYDLTLPAEYADLAYNAMGYGGFPPPTYEFAPFVLSLNIPDPDPNVITVTVSDSTATEPSTNTTATDKGTFTFKRTGGDTTTSLSINYTIGGTATIGTDYTSFATRVTFAANQTTVSRHVVPLYDTLNEGNETVIVTLTDGENYTIGTSASASVIIKDVPPVITVKTNPSTGGTATGAYVSTPGQNYKLTAIPNTGYKFTNWTKSDGTVASTANPYTFSVTETATYTANFESDLPNVTVAATDAIATEPSTNTTATDKGTFTFTRTGGTDATLTVYCSGSGTATKNTDYTDIGTSVNFAVGSSTVTKAITPKYDTNNEGDETVVVTLTSKTTYNIANPKTATVTIVDSAPVITVNATPATGGTVTGAYTATPGQNYKLTATAATGYTFKQWTKGDGTVASTSNPYTFSVTGTATYTAVFEKSQDAAPDWLETINTQTLYNMTLAATVILPDGINAEEEGSLLGVFDGDVCCGFGAWTDTPFGIVYEGMVYSNESSVENLSMKFYEASTGEILDIWETLNFGADLQMGNQVEPLELHAGIMSIVWKLKQGWNWVSMNVVPADASLDAIFAGYTPTAGDQIKSSTASSTYYDTSRFTGWSPSLNLQPGVMYMVRRQAVGTEEVTINGTPCPANNELVLKTGWNWIGLFTGDETANITSLAYSGGFAQNDQLKGQTTSATYYVTSTFTGWSGSLKQLSNNQGYKLKVANPGILTITPATRGAYANANASVRSESCPWPAPDDATAYNMTFCVVLKNTDGSYLENENTVVGIFQGDTIIGNAVYTETPFGNVYEGFIYNNSSKVEGLSIKIWNGIAEQEIILDETATFEADTTWGDEFEPVELSIPEGEVPETFIVTVNEGITDKNEVAGGEIVTITANEPEEGMEFDVWTSGDGVEFEDATSATTTFTMPAKNVTVTANYKPVNYEITVLSGTSDKAEASKDETVMITADDAPEGMAFDRWTTDDGVDFANAAAETTTFVMPAKAVTVTAIYKPFFTITVGNGMSDRAVAFEGETVKITADAPGEGCRFVSWATDDGVAFAEASSSVTSFTMPAKAVTVTATYECPFPVTVENGTADRAVAFEGETVKITANAPEEGFVFDQWTTEDGVVFADSKAATTTFNMPAKSVTITATYKEKTPGYDEWPEDLTLYAPTIANGGSGIFRETDDLAVTFSWPAINNAENYRLVVVTYNGGIVADETVEVTSCTVYGLKRGSFIWNVTANGDGSIAGTSQDFVFAVAENNGSPVIRSGKANGTSIELACYTDEKYYTDGVFTYQVFFYSMKTNSWTSLKQDVEIVNGQAVIDIGVDTSNGYLYIRPVTTPESDFVELYVE